MTPSALRLLARAVAWLLIVAGSSACVPSVYDQPYRLESIELPADDAAHAAPIEWWYWVGHLELDDGRRLAFQLTFFEAYAPPELRLAGIPSNWFFEKELVAHAASIDLDRGEHDMAQRGFALWDGSASMEELDVRMADWRAVRAPDGVSHQLTFAVGGYAFDLTLTPEKRAALHGEPPGFQSMGPGGVSAYVSHTRMRVAGTVRGPCGWPAVCPAVATVGQAWFDHQWGDFRIDRFGGWDWFALQLDDGRDLMLYLIRDDEGRTVGADGSLVTVDGRTLFLDSNAFALDPTGTSWTSPATGAVYPAEWRVWVPEHELDLTITPMVADQEMDTRATTGIVYWEGPVRIEGSAEGRGFVELTNYDRQPFSGAGFLPMGR